MAATKKNTPTVCKVSDGANLDGANLDGANLRDCPLVTSEWNGDESMLVKSGDRVEVEMDQFEVLDRDTYEAICDAKRAEKEVEKAAAQSAVEPAQGSCS